MENDGSCNKAALNERGDDTVTTSLLCHNLQTDTKKEDWKEAVLAKGTWTVWGRWILGFGWGGGENIGKERYSLDLINDYIDDIGGGRRGMESSSVPAGCSLETKDMDELSLWTVEDEARSVSHLAKTSCLSAGCLYGLKCAPVPLVLACCTWTIYKLVSRKHCYCLIMLA